MRRLATVVLLLVVFSSPALFAADANIPLRPVHTFSIVARDAATGELGVAVQSHAFSVGSGVSWAEAGVGAVATQSFIDPAYGPLGLDLMRAGRSAPDSLKSLIAGDDDDPAAESRELKDRSFADARRRAGRDYGLALHPLVLWKPPLVCKRPRRRRERTPGSARIWFRP